MAGGQAFFTRAVTEFVRWTGRNPDATRLLIEANRTGSEVSAWCAERHMKPIFGVFGALIAQGQQDGFVRDGTVIHLYYQIISTVMVFTIPDEVRLLGGDETRDEGFIDAQAAMLTAMLLRRPA